MTREFFSSATLKAIHWPYRMIAMKSAIERPNETRKLVTLPAGSVVGLRVRDRRGGSRSPAA